MPNRTRLVTGSEGTEDKAMNMENPVNHSEISIHS